MRVKNLLISLCLAWLVGSAPSALADGMVFQPEVHAKVEIPNQQALIHFADGVEDLVIETTFLAKGTNFAWIVPLPAAPEIMPVSEAFFPSLQHAFQPRLVHEVHRYYLGVLFMCGLAFLGWRSFKDEVSWMNDLPLCLVLAAGIWFLGKYWLFGAVALGFTLYARILIRSTASLAMVLVIGLVVAFSITVLPGSGGFGLIGYMGAEERGQAVAGVEVVSFQHAGVFDSTTIRGANSRAVLEWLNKNGYDFPQSIEPVVSRYVQDNWVFVASKARRENAQAGPTALHPLAFKFAAHTPVYPLKLTSVSEGRCAIDLYVFGRQRASARLFQAVRCDQVAANWQPGQDIRWKSWLIISDPEVLQLIGHSTVGTKLTAHLSPAQMDSDAEIKESGFGTKGAWAFSPSGATTVAANVAVTLAALSWLLVGMCRGGWNVDEKFIRRWRWRLVAAAMLVGIIVFVSLPKVEVVVAQSGTSVD